MYYLYDKSNNKLSYKNKDLTEIRMWLFKTKDPMCIYDLYEKKFFRKKFKGLYVFTEKNGWDVVNIKIDV